jgi:hypothetical protein
MNETAVEFRAPARVCFRAEPLAPVYSPVLLLERAYSQAEPLEPAYSRAEPLEPAWSPERT